MIKKDVWVPAYCMQGFRIFIEKRENGGYFGVGMKLGFYGQAMP